MSKQLTSEELGNLQELNNSFTQSKISLGDLELQKENIIGNINKLKVSLSN